MIIKKQIIEQLRKEVFSLQENRKSSSYKSLNTGIPSLEASFPNHTFPTGVVHEFISMSVEDATATNGFISGLISLLNINDGICLWISTHRTLFPPALSIFGIKPERVIFIDCKRQKDVLWAIEESLKCNVLSLVVSELSELSFKESRRLQLAVEESKVTGFIHRYQPKSENTVACVTRWKVKSLPSELKFGMPGVGSPRWQVALLKVRNGHTGIWDIEWRSEAFKNIIKQTPKNKEIPIRKAI